MTVSATSRTEQIELLLAAYDGPRDLAISPALDLFLFLFLCRRRSAGHAREGLARLRLQFVDWNEVRVSSPHEIALAIVPRVTKEAEEEAAGIRELLAHVYAKHNKLDLDFMLPKSRDPEDTKRRERMASWLSDRFPSVTPFFEFALSDRAKALTHPHLLRILPRLGWVAEKPNLTIAREALSEGLSAEESVAVQWGLLQVGESYCHAKGPNCSHCPLQAGCPSAQVEATEAPNPEVKSGPTGGSKPVRKSRSREAAASNSQREATEVTGPRSAKKAAKGTKSSTGQQKRPATKAGGDKKVRKSPTPPTSGAKKAKKQPLAKSGAAGKKTAAKAKTSSPKESAK